MQQKSIDTKQKYSINSLKDIKLTISKPMIIFLYGDLGSGKTTFCQHILHDLVGIQEDVCSPTYTYYNKYGENYHFDLYRISHYDEFFAIGGEEVLDNNSGIILIEWPELIKPYYSPDISIYLERTNNEDEREVLITYHS